MTRTELITNLVRFAKAYSVMTANIGSPFTNELWKEMEYDLSTLESELAAGELEPKSLENKSVVSSEFWGTLEYVEPDNKYTKVSHTMMNMMISGEDWQQSKSNKKRWYVDGKTVVVKGNKISLHNFETGKTYLYNY